MGCVSGLTQREEQSWNDILLQYCMLVLTCNGFCSRILKISQNVAEVINCELLVEVI